MPASASRAVRIRGLVERYSNPIRLMRQMTAKRLNQLAERNHLDLRESLYFADAEGDCFPSDIELLRTHDVNLPECIEFARRKDIDCVAVNGTNLLRAPWFELATEFRYGIINIHTGLSPYSRGGNCNLFCTLHGQMQCIGVTVHYIDAGIDSGQILFTDRPRIEPTDNMQSIEYKVFRLGEDLLVHALDLIEQKSISPTPQWLHGRLFLRRTGYVFEPWLTVLANRKLQSGLLERYLRRKQHFDASARILPPAALAATWRHPRV